jgi:hypothetical protein
MTIQGAFETALLRYIQAEVDQLAEGIQSWEQLQGSCYGHEYDDSCCCDTSVSIDVNYKVPREVARYGFKTWNYRGNFYDLINMLDQADILAEVKPRVITP